MTDNPIDEAKATLDQVKRTDELYIYYADVVAQLPRLERHHALLDMLVARHRDHEAACKLAWELYLAGTGQSQDEFRLIEGDPVDEVKASRKALLTRGLGIQSMPRIGDDVRNASKLAGACGPECAETHTYEAGSCRMFTFGSGYAPGTREQ